MYNNYETAFWDVHFWLTDLKIFLKAPLAPIYTNFEGGARAKKNVNLRSKFLLFKFDCGAENLIKLRSLLWFGRAQKINLVSLKKVDKIFLFFENPPPLFEKFLSPCLHSHNYACKKLIRWCASFFLFVSVVTGHFLLPIERASRNDHD